IEDKFCASPNHYSSGKGYLFFITKNSFDIHEIQSTERIQSLVNQFIGNIKQQAFYVDHELIHEYINIAVALFTSLFGSAQNHLNEFDKIIISSDGALTNLPFEALLSEECNVQVFSQLPYLVNHLYIQYIPSARLLIDQRSKAIKKINKASIALIEDLSLNDRALKNSSIEVRGIEGIIGKKLDVFRFRSSSVTNKRDLVDSDEFKGSKIIHFACHGIVDESHKNGALLLSSNNSELTITGNEILGIDVQADLVVMSSCESALGNYERGEGLNGLMRSWYCSGVQSVISSLWKVGDKASSIYMSSLYNLILKGNSVYDSNSVVKRQLINNEIYSAPYNWAGYILFGDYQLSN
ncbi:MAG: CHAT domain-containing protein, partial [Bacteroidota bacterium]